ncbi:Uncharacterised protein [Mycobacteroides abscessus subsp. abscessus]|nr:Uncharacterised protein [Mycobacteroides abscessus subsp. abscessus]
MCALSPSLSSPSKTTIAEESESYCWNTLPMFNIPWYDSEFCGLSGTDRLAATSVRDGVTVPRMTASATQNRMIGSERTRIRWPRNGRCGFACRLLIRISPSSR